MLLKNPIRSYVYITKCIENLISFKYIHTYINNQDIQLNLNWSRYSNNAILTCVWPSITLSHLPVFIFHTRRVLSQLPDTILPSDSTATHKTIYIYVIYT